MRAEKISRTELAERFAAGSKNRRDISRATPDTDAGEISEGLDLAATSPKDISVADRDADRLEVAIDGCLVLEEAILIGAMRHSHDVYVMEFRASFTPVAMGEHFVSADFGARFDLAACGHGPVEKAVESRDPDAALRGLDVLEKGREAAMTLRAFRDSAISKTDRD